MKISIGVVRIFLLAMTIYIVVGCNTKCLSTGGVFNVDNWNEKIPKKGVLYRYKSGSNFAILEKKNESGFTAWLIKQPNPGAKPTLAVQFIGDEVFSTESDYKLVLDNKIEYRIYDLKSGYGEQGCPLLGGKVNKCDLLGGSGFNVPGSCGEPVK
jgi:hypothetical protein